MKAIVIHEYGGPDVLKYEDYPDPAPGAGEVLVRVAAASINPIDIMERAGLTKDFKPVTFPGVLGWDLAGTVIEPRAGGARILGRRQSARVGLPHLRGALRSEERSFSRRFRTAWTLSRQRPCRSSRQRGIN